MQCSTAAAAGNKPISTTTFPGRQEHAWTGACRGICLHARAESLEAYMAREQTRSAWSAQEPDSFSGQGNMAGA